MVGPGFCSVAQTLRLAFSFSIAQWQSRFYIT